MRALIAAGLVLFSACSSLVASSPQPTNEASSSAPPSPLAAASAAPSASPTETAPSSTPSTTPDPCCVVVPSPVPNETLGESDAFWEFWSDYPFDGPVNKVDSLAENVALAHLVVRGHITDLYVGEQFNMADQYEPLDLGYVRIAVSEVLKGEPRWRNPGFVEVYVGRLTQQRRDALEGKLPQHDAVWFLMHEITVQPRSSANETEIAPYAYLMTNDLQAVFRDIEGKVRVIHPDWTEEIPQMGPAHFPLELEGSDFLQLVTDIKLAATR